MREKIRAVAFVTLMEGNNNGEHTVEIQIFIDILWKLLLLVASCVAENLRKTNVCIPLSSCNDLILQTIALHSWHT